MWAYLLLVFHPREEISISLCDEMVSVFPSSSNINAAYPSLENLFIFPCSRVEPFSEEGLLPSSIKSLYIGGCNLLMANRMNWNLQTLSSFETLRFIGYEEVEDPFPRRRSSSNYFKASHDLGI
ncbi:hypothetical protein PanWU01x14_337560 [Parasponia andersonii]|uniref:LRR domain containing protein n=1 Tax=Parasponia andersonii TaxID=3476 RepID=A0A2P5AFG8_PARAD|nr:hypothetical protein PanWU01x14_337560 [Parasponia andersonii]